MAMAMAGKALLADGATATLLLLAPEIYDGAIERGELILGAVTTVGQREKRTGTGSRVRKRKVSARGNGSRIYGLATAGGRRVRLLGGGIAVRANYSRFVARLRETPFELTQCRARSLRFPLWASSCSCPLR